MMSINNIVKNNLNHFNTEVPPEGHFERFKKKLDVQEVRTRRAYLMNVLRIAALVLFVFLVSVFFFREYVSWDENNSNTQLFALNQELVEAERYYTALLETYYDEIETLEFQSNRNEKRQVLQELREMDKQVEMMKNDLRQYPDNELIMNAIINFYQIKLEMMNDIIMRINNMNNSLL